MLCAFLSIPLQASCFPDQKTPICHKQLLRRQNNSAVFFMQNANRLPYFHCSLSSSHTYNVKYAPALHSITYQAITMDSIQQLQNSNYFFLWYSSQMRRNTWELQLAFLSTVHSYFRYQSVYVHIMTSDSRNVTPGTRQAFLEQHIKDVGRHQ